MPVGPGHRRYSIECLSEPGRWVCHDAKKRSFSTVVRGGSSGGGGGGGGDAAAEPEAEFAKKVGVWKFMLAPGWTDALELAPRAPKAERAAIAPAALPGDEPVVGDGIKRKKPPLPPRNPTEGMWFMVANPQGARVSRSKEPLSPVLGQLPGRGTPEHVMGLEVVLPRISATMQPCNHRIRASLKVRAADWTGLDWTGPDRTGSRWCAESTAFR